MFDIIDSKKISEADFLFFFYLGIFELIMGAIGLIGIFKTKKTLVLVFNIMNIIVFIGSIILMVSGI